MRRRLALSSIAALSTVLTVAVALPAQAAPARIYATRYTVDPIVVPAALPTSTTAATAAIDITPEDCLAAYGQACQTPASIRSAYDLPDTVAGRVAGTGQSIALVVAYGSPTLASDLALFDDDFALPAAPLKVWYPQGPVAFDASSDEQLSWAQEASLDVQWAHAAAPAAALNVVVAKSSDNDDLVAAEKYAVDHRLGSVLSLSFGEDEADIDPRAASVANAHKVYQAAATAGITVVAAAGDAGSDNGTGHANFNFPASDPLVTAVGGTTLLAGSGVAGPAETVWGDYAGTRRQDEVYCPFGCTYGPWGATGGAPSILRTSSFVGKAGSDVALNANGYTGYITELGFFDDPSLDGTYFVGGTSAAAPIWAGIVATLDQAAGRPLGTLNDDLASWSRAGALTDVTVGSNATPTFTAGFSAKPGWDPATGYGTPDGVKLLKAVSKSSYGWSPWVFGPSWGVNHPGQNQPHYPTSFTPPRDPTGHWFTPGKADWTKAVSRQRSQWAKFQTKGYAHR